MELEKIAIAIGLITPLILGILAFIEKFMNRKKPQEDDSKKEEKTPEVIQGMTVKPDFAAELMTELRRERDEAEEEAREAIRQRDRAVMELEAYKQANR